MFVKFVVADVVVELGGSVGLVLQPHHEDAVGAVSGIESTFSSRSKFLKPLITFILGYNDHSYNDHGYNNHGYNEITAVTNKF